MLLPSINFDKAFRPIFLGLTVRDMRSYAFFYNGYWQLYLLKINILTHLFPLIILMREIDNIFRNVVEVGCSNTNFNQK